MSTKESIIELNERLRGGLSSPSLDDVRVQNSGNADYKEGLMDKRLKLEKKLLGLEKKKIEMDIELSRVLSPIEKKVFIDFYIKNYSIYKIKTLNRLKESDVIRYKNSSKLKVKFELG